MKLQQKEYEERTAALTTHVQELGLSGVVLFDPTYVLYYVGFASSRRSGRWRFC